jgi:hypothetical protein
MRLGQSEVGDKVSGPGVPEGTRVVAIDRETVTLSQSLAGINGGVGPVVLERDPNRPRR